MNDDVAERSLAVDAVMLQDLPHADVHLEEDSEELRILDRHLEALEGIAGSIHAGEEVEDDVSY